MEAEVLESFKKVDGAIGSINTNIEKLNKMWEPKPATDNVDLAENVASRTMDKFSRFEVMNVPVGQAILGGFTAVMTTEIIDGFLITQTPLVTGGVKLVAAAIAGGFGKQLLGKTGATAAALLIAFDGVRDILPIDTWAKSIAVRISGILPSRGLSQGARGNVIRQVNQVARSYYARAGI